MARRRRTSSARPIVVRSAPSRPIVVRTGGSRRRRYLAHARRYGSAAVGAASSEKHTLLALAAAAGYGMLRKSGVKIPSFGPFGPASTAGLALWAFGRWGSNRTASHMATGLLSIAAYQYVTTGEVVGEGVASVWDD